MPSFWTHQPGTGLYTAYTILKALASLPFLMVYYMPSSLRPNPRWSSRQAVSCALVRLWFKYAAAVEFQMPFNLDPGKEKERFTTVAPHPTDPGQLVYHGIPFSDPGIKPITIGATWHPAPLSTPYQHQPGARVFLHFHGGAYVLFGVRDHDIGFGATLMLNPSKPGSAAFFPQYRLASCPDGRFPAALQDAVTAYAHLVLDLGVPPDAIVLSGDSAGGHLALALLRYICNDSKGVLPEPGGLLLWSPWVDLTLTAEDLAKRPNEQIDILPPSLLRWAARVFAPLPKGGEDPFVNPYVSPVKEAIATRVPIWVTWGDQEVLRDDILAFVEKQKKASELSGGRLGVLEIPLAPHGLFLGGQGMGFEDESIRAGEDAIRFLDAS